MHPLLKHPRYIPSYLKHRKELFLVYTMGKVGSSSLFRHLKEHFPFLPVFQVHFLSDAFLKDELPGSHFAQNVHKGERVKEFLNQHSQKRWKLISLVRDPVGRAISNFFENPGQFIDGHPSDRSPDEIASLIREKADCNYALEWFDKEFYAYTGFDVYDEPFDKEKGFSIYEYAPQRELLLFRMEDLDRDHREGLKAFLGEDPGEMKRENVKEDRSLYQEVKTRFTLPRETLDAIYSSKYMQHFYTPEEIERFKAKWADDGS